MKYDSYSAIFCPQKNNRLEVPYFLFQTCFTALLKNTTNSRFQNRTRELLSSKCIQIPLFHSGGLSVETITSFFLIVTVVMHFFCNWFRFLIASICSEVLKENLLLFFVQLFWKILICWIFCIEPAKSFQLIEKCAGKCSDVYRNFETE